MTDFNPFRYLAVSLLITLLATQTSIAQSYEESNERVFEMRIYTANDGKLDALENRFRTYTMDLFEEHGIENIGYWIPDDPETSQNTLIYIISYENRKVAQERWDAFFNSPEWQEISARTNADGNLVKHVESVFMHATDYSPIN